DFDVKEIIGKSATKILGHERARTLEMHLKETRQSNRAMTTLDQRPDEKGVPHFMQSHFEIIAPFGDFKGGIIMRSEDVTGLIIERERRENMLRQVIGTL